MLDAPYKLDKQNCAWVLVEKQPVFCIDQEIFIGKVSVYTETHTRTVLFTRSAPDLGFFL